MITTTYVVGSRRGCAVGCVSVAVVESWGRRRLLAMVVGCVSASVAVVESQSRGRRRLLAMVVVSESEQTGVRNNITSTGDILVVVVIVSVYKWRLNISLPEWIRC